MQSLTHATSITEAAATEIIMDACRANPERNAYRTPASCVDYAVTFNAFAFDMKHEAVVRDANGFVVALATVDKFDN